MSIDLTAGIVRILDQAGATVGAGFVVSDEGLIATCAHVVELAGSGADGTVKIAFHDTGKIAEASVKSEGWSPADVEDTAFLQVTGSLPPSVIPLVLGASAGREGAQVRAFGYPHVGRMDGVWGGGNYLGTVNEGGRPFLQLRSSEITAGFSGAPVWEAEAGRVIGMVATIFVADKYHRLSETAFAIPVETLRGLVPGLIPPPEIPALLSPHFRTHFPYNEHFVGRDAEFSRLHQTLMRERSGRHQPVGLTGMGGIGKTQLAAEYARRYQDDYSGGVFGVDATNEKDWAEQLVEQADWLGLTPADPHTRDRTGQMIAALSRHLGEQSHSLILFDNVRDPHQLKSLSLGAGITVAELGGLLLFTTRQRELPPGMVSLEVPLLLPPGARQMIVEARPQAADDPALGELCQVLDNLPLALALAAAALRHRPRMDLSGYLRKLRHLGPDSVHERARVTPDDLAQYYANSLTPALKAQWNMLRSKNARFLLRAAAELGEARSIPITWLELLTELQGDESGLEEPLSDAVHELWAVSLVEFIGDDCLRLHSLVRDFVARKMTPEKRRVFHSQLEANAVAALQDPAHRWQRAIVAGECLLDLQQIPAWSPATMRHATLEALRELMCADEASPEDRRTAALLLTRLRWADDAQDIPFDELSNCLEFAGRDLHSSADRRYLVEAITSQLNSRAPGLGPRQRARLFVYRAGYHGYLGDLDAAEGDFQQARGRMGELLGSGKSQPEDKRSLARIYLGLANVIRLKAERLPQPVDRNLRRELARRAQDAYHKALELARSYGQDVILEATILKESSMAHVLLENWGEAEDACRQALTTLDEKRGQIDDQAFMRCRTMVLEKASDVLGTKGESLREKGESLWPQAFAAYEAGLHYAEEGISLLSQDSEDLVGKAIAHYNAGDCLLGLSLCTDSGAEAYRIRACEAWQRALEVAEPLGPSDLVDQVKEKLQQYRPRTGSP